MNFNRDFWIKTFKENGFEIEPKIYPIPTDIQEKIMRYEAIVENQEKIIRYEVIVENIEVLYDNFPAQIIFVYAMVPYNRENRYRITKGQARFIVRMIRDLDIITGSPLFIISDGHDSYTFTSVIERKTWKPIAYIVRHFSGKITPAKRKMLKHLFREVADLFRDEYRWFWLDKIEL